MEIFNLFMRKNRFDGCSWLETLKVNINLLHIKKYSKTYYFDVKTII